VAGLVELHSIFFILGYALAAWVGFGFYFWGVEVQTTPGDRHWQSRPDLHFLL
jgi:hypothetical protein